MTDRQVYERVLAELHRCEDRAEQLRSFVRLYEEFAQSERATGTAFIPEKRGAAQPEKVVEEWERMVDSAIRQAGKPLRAGEIYDAITPMGFHIKSKSPVDALATRLARSPHFSRAARGLYSVLGSKAVTNSDEQADEEEPEHSDDRGNGVERTANADLWGS